MPTKRLLVLAFPLALAMPVHAQTAQTQPGEYAYEVKVKVMGMSMPAIKFKQCVTRQDIDQGRAFVNTDKKADCTPAVPVWKDDTFTVSATCKSPERSMSGKGSASSTGFQLVMDVEVKGSMPMTQHQTVTAARLGDCRK